VMFKAFDADGDGRISVGEFLGWDSQMRKGKDQEKLASVLQADAPGQLDLAAAQRLWRQYDEDKNGVLDRNEADKLFFDFLISKGFNAKDARQEIEELWRTFDVDGDGKITFAELMGWDTQSWTCTRCNFINQQGKHPICFMCSAMPPQEEDWAVWESRPAPSTPKLPLVSPSVAGPASASARAPVDLFDWAFDDASASAKPPASPQAAPLAGTPHGKPAMAPTPVAMAKPLDAWAMFDEPAQPAQPKRPVQPLQPAQPAKVAGPSAALAPPGNKQPAKGEWSAFDDLF